MKQIAGVIILMVISQLAFSQTTNQPDPTYSAGNYKHPNKAAYAKEHNLDKSTKLETVDAADNSNYKTPYSAKKVKKAAMVVSSDKSKARGSYKHPQGL
ncbi:MAG TPA: hypothetical protein VL443_02565 [Cyclobacteriaceae bacterium]|jgi:hypothetical protein|nr:hypothetical protein [Cyclobacteriaceae bacterium]